MFWVPGAACALDALLTTCWLIEANVAAYGELAGVLCLQVYLLNEQQVDRMSGGARTRRRGRQGGQGGLLLQGEEEEEAAGGPAAAAARQGGGGGGGGDTQRIVHDRVAYHPIVLALQDQLREYEAFLGAAADEALRGPLGKAMNAVCVLFAGYLFCMLFHVFFVMIEVMYIGRTQYLVVTILLVVLTFLVLGLLAKALGAMAHQAQAWGKLAATYAEGNAYQKVSAILSANNDEFALGRHLQELQGRLTWTIAGQPITYGAITGAVMSYAAAVFFAFIFPAVNSTIDAAKEAALASLNQTMAGTLSMDTVDTVVGLAGSG